MKWPHTGGLLGVPGSASNNLPGGVQRIARTTPLRFQLQWSHSKATGPAGPWPRDDLDDAK